MYETKNDNIISPDTTFDIATKILGGSRSSLHRSFQWTLNMMRIALAGNVITEFLKIGSKLLVQNSQRVMTVFSSNIETNGSHARDNHFEVIEH